MSSLSASGTPSPSPSSSPASSTSPGDPNSNLYLFTFLATLILLLVVSCSVIARAFCLRRRFRRTVDRAMEQGLSLAPSEKAFVVPPKLYDVWLLSDKHPSSSWVDITPISVQPVPIMDGELFSDWKNKSTVTVSSRSASTMRSGTIRSDSSSEAFTSAMEAIQVSVLVAMPQPPSVETESEDYLPEVVLGFTQSRNLS